LEHSLRKVDRSLIAVRSQAGASSSQKTFDFRGFCVVAGAGFDLRPLGYEGKGYFEMLGLVHLDALT
jgi:hypothetical protein